LLLVSSLGFTTAINTSSDQIVILSSLTGHENMLDLSNGKIDQFWENITSQGVPEFGNGSFVKFSNNGTHIYSLFAAPANKIWISIQMSTTLAGTDPMSPGSFAWTFYINSDGVTRAEIQEFLGTFMPVTHDELPYESIVEDGMVYIETVRSFVPLIDGDINFSNGSSTYMVFASESQRYGHIIDDNTIFRLNVIVTEPAPADENTIETSNDEYTTETCNGEDTAETSKDEEEPLPQIPQNPLNISIFVILVNFWIIYGINRIRQI
jgi:hypothetical protein